MLLTTKGIVLNSTKYKDNSLITQLYTSEKGIISIISNRGKGKTSKNSILRQAFSLVDLVCYYNQKSNIHRLKEISFHKKYNPNNTNIIIGSISFFITEFLVKTIKEEEENTNLFNYLENQCLLLNESESVDPHYILIFLISLTTHLGIEPRVYGGSNYFDLQDGVFTDIHPIHKNYCKGKQVDLLKELIFGSFQLDKTQRKSSLNTLILYYSIQLQQEIKLKSQEVLEAVFA